MGPLFSGHCLFILLFYNPFHAVVWELINKYKQSILYVTSFTDNKGYSLPQDITVVISFFTKSINTKYIWSFSSVNEDSPQNAEIRNVT